MNINDSLSLVVGDFVSVVQAFDSDEGLIFVLGGLSSSEAQKGSSEVESILLLYFVPGGSASGRFSDSSGGGHGLRFSSGGFCSCFLFH